MRLYEDYMLGFNRSPTENQDLRTALMAHYPEAAEHAFEEARRFVGDRDWIVSNTAANEINTDWRPRAEFYLGRP